MDNYARATSTATSLGEDASLRDGARHPLHRDYERGLAQRAVVHRRLREHELHRPPHVDLEPLLDLFELPVELGAALHPLEIADHDAARVREDVRRDQHAAIREQAVRLRGHRTVRALHDDAGAYLVSVVAGDLALERGWNEHVDVHREQFRVRDARDAGEPVERSRGIAPHMLDRARDVDAGRIRVAAADVGDRDDAAPRRGERLRRHAADVAESLDRDARLGWLLPLAPKHLER